MTVNRAEMLVMVGVSRLARFQKGKQPRSLDGLDEVIVRVTTWVALGFFALMVASGLVLGDNALLTQALVPGATGLVGYWMLVRKSPRVIVQLITSGTFMALTTSTSDLGSRSGALFGLLSMGIVGALLVRRQLAVYMVGASTALFAAAFWWNIGGWSSWERVGESVVPAFAFLFAGGLVVWLKRELLLEGSERRDAADALATSEEQFRMAFETSAAGMMLVDMDNGRFLRVNRAWCDLLGYSATELVGMTVWQVLHEDDIAEGQAMLAGVVSGDVEHSQATLRHITSDGSVAFGLVSAALVTDPAGNPRHVVGQVVDMTVQHAAEQRLLDLLSSRDELIASVSHELRTPLTAVLGYAGLLLEAAPGEPPADYGDMLGEIVHQGSDLVAIIEDLLVFAQSDAQSLTVTPSRVNVKQQLGLVLGSLDSLVDVGQVAVTGPDVDALADPVRIRQVLRNLLSNARRYGGDSVAVILDSTESQVRIVVSDNGSGVPPRDRERIFEPYQRSRPKDGLTAAIGVGLTVARRLARLMGGDLSYSYRGGWSRFEFSLPSVSQSTVLADPGGTRSPSSEPKSSHPVGGRS